MTAQHGRTDEFVSGPLFDEVGTKPHRFTTTDLILAATLGLAAGIWTAYLITVAADRVFG